MHINLAFGSKVGWAKSCLCSHAEFLFSNIFSDFPRANLFNIFSDFPRANFSIWPIKLVKVAWLWLNLWTKGQIAGGQIFSFWFFFVADKLFNYLIISVVKSSDILLELITSIMYTIKMHQLICVLNINY